MKCTTQNQSDQTPLLSIGLVTLGMQVMFMLVLLQVLTKMKAPKKLATEEYVDNAKDFIILNSSTEGSIKKFKITVDDSGAITATELS